MGQENSHRVFRVREIDRQKEREKNKTKPFFEAGREIGSVPQKRGRFEATLQLPAPDQPRQDGLWLLARPAHATLIY